MSKFVIYGKALLVLGGIAVSIDPSQRAGFSPAAFLVIMACVCWGLDNCLTRDVEARRPGKLALCPMPTLVA